jgi:tyrosinase
MSSNQADGSGARMVTRRRVISRSLAFGGAALWPAVFLTTRRAEAKTGTRYDVSTKEGKAALVKLEEAIRLMKDETKFRKTHPFSYFYQAGFHGVRLGELTDKDKIIETIFENANKKDKRDVALVWNTCVNHYGESLGVRNALRDWFLPWHRMYLYYFERIVRHVLLDPAFMLPYWNWSNPAQRALPEPFLKNTSSLYNDTRFSKDDKEKTIPNIAGGEPFDKFIKGHSYQTDLGLPGCIKTADYKAFSEETIETPHSAVHARVGSDMQGVFAAAYDPIFWLHHGNVDRLWTIWSKSTGPEKKPHSNPDAPDWQSKAFPFFDVVDGKPVFTNSTTSAFVDTKKLLSPYQYDNEKGMSIKATLALAKARIPELARELAAAPPLPPGATLVASGLTMSGTSPVRLAFKGQPTGATLHSLAARCDDLHPLRLRLHNVEADRQPGSTYPLLLDLMGADGGEDLHFAGEQVFFDNVVPPGRLAGNFGRDSSYNISETVLGLAAAGRLAEATSLTIVPRGDPTVRVSIAGATIKLG